MRDRALHYWKLVDGCWAPLYLAIFAAILVVQLFLPPSVGLADNADSMRIIGGEGLVPNYPLDQRYFRYFTPDYLRFAPDPTPKPARWFTGRIPFKFAEWIGAWKSQDHFDVRWMGLVHMTVYLFNFALLLFLLRHASSVVKWVVPAVAIWAYGDVFYVAYLNSLYLDTMGFLCFQTAVLTMIALLVLDRPGLHAPGLAAFLFAASSVAFAASKPLDAPVAVLFGIGVALRGLSSRGVVRRRIVSAGVVAALGGVLVIATTPRWYQAPALVDAVMIRIAKLPNATHELQYFGLASSDLQFAGQDAFRAHGPSGDVGFGTRFAHNTAGTLVAWYATHPRETAGFLETDLMAAAPVLRPLGDLEKQYATRPWSDHFCSWSNLQSAILRRVPLAIPLVYVLALTLAGALMIVQSWARYNGFGLVLGSVALSGVVQFTCGSLLDAIEVPRHLFMFHVSTDVMLMLLFAGGLWRLSERVPYDR